MSSQGVTDVSTTNLLMARLVWWVPSSGPLELISPKKKKLIRARVAKMSGEEDTKAKINNKQMIN